MKPHQLRYLAAFATQGSVRAAARALKVSPAAVTQGLKELQEDTQLQLFERQGHGLRLSAAATALLPYAQKTVLALQETESAAMRLRDSVLSQKLTLSVMPWVARAVLPKVIPAFRAVMPHVQLELLDGLATQAYPRLRDGSLDLFVGRILTGHHMDGLSDTPLFTYEKTVIARKNHPKSEARSLAALAGSDWALNFSTVEREEYLHSIFGQHGIPAPERHIHLIHSSALMLTMVEYTDMLSVCPWPSIETWNMQDRIIALALKEKLSSDTVGIVRRAHQTLSPAEQAFIELLLQVIQEWKSSTDPQVRRLMHSMDILWEA